MASPAFRLTLTVICMLGLCALAYAIGQADTSAAPRQMPAPDICCPQFTPTISPTGEVPLADLTISLRAVQEPSCSPGQSGIIAIVRNWGRSSDPFVVSVNGVRQQSPGLGWGAQREFFFLGLDPTANVGTVDADQQVAEGNEANNQASLSSPPPVPACTPTSASAPPPPPTAQPCSYPAQPATLGLPLVEPVLASTNQLTQTIAIFTHHATNATVSLETGTFVGMFASGVARIAVPLQPNATNHLTVSVDLLTWPRQCHSGWTYPTRFRYTTQADRYGQPLTITQRTPPSACRVRYTTQSQWHNGFVADVAVTNSSATALQGWNLGWQFAGDQRIVNMWNAVPLQSGASISARNADWNRTLLPGGTATFGFQASYSGSNAAPTGFTLNGSACEVVR